ncbi:MAG TPA: Tm-1-like ATP-binding domain-containing protein [Ramlibacter sp.]|nr:Tm-1-like ATP-binding domain-containing protein [Ramlibacter sp.]
MKKVYVVGTCDTKQDELLYVRDLVTASGVDAVLVDVATGQSGGAGDVSPEVVAAHHPRGAGAVLGLTDRGRAVEAMSMALEAYLARQSDIGGVIGLGGGGNTSLVTRAMRALAVGTPKLMVSTIASGNVAPYVGLSDICMMPAVTDVAGLNPINRVVLANAAAAMVGMVRGQPGPIGASALPAIGLTQFGVTTPCVDQLRDRLASSYECVVFHATGVGGQVMEKLLDSSLLSGLLDITTTEVADYLVGGVLACTEDRFGALARTRRPCVVSCGALDMVNFGPRVTVPARFALRRFHVHNAQVTLMRTTPKENTRIGEWIATRLNACGGPLALVVPEGGVSALDAPGQPFHDPKADRALFDALESNLRTSPSRRLLFSPAHINSESFVDLLSETYAQLAA